MPRTSQRSIALIAAGQRGLVTRPQLRGLRLTGQAIDQLIRSGALIVVHPGVYRLPGIEPSWDQSLLAAYFASNGAGVISHLASAVEWKFEGIVTDGPHILLPHEQRLKLVGVEVYRTRVLPERDVTSRHGLPLTKPARTIMDVASLVGVFPLEIALDDILRRQIATVDQIQVCLDERGPSGIRGWGTLQRLVNERRGTKPTGSGKETRFRRALIGRGLPTPIGQYEVRDDDGRFVACVDFAYPELKLAIEVDGGHHASRAQWESDLARQNRLTLQHWRFLRFPRTDRAGQRAALDTIEAAFAAFGEPQPSSTWPGFPKRR